MKRENTLGILGCISRIREQTTQFIQEELDARGLTGIVPAHGRVLMTLFRADDPVTMTTLMERAGRVKSTITSIVRTLEKHGYVRKFQSTEDGRVMLVELTQEGRGIFPDFMEISELVMKRVYGDMPESERQQLARLLARIERNLGDNG